MAERDHVRERVVSAAKQSRAVHGVGRLVDALVPAPTRLCTVATFHRIDTHRPELYPGLAGLDANEFETFVGELADRFRPIGIDEFTAALAGDVELRPRSLLMTFDDAYRDFAEVAWPILRAAGVPALLFVPTAYPGDPDRQFWWDHLYSAIAVTGPSAWRAVGIVADRPDEAFRSVRDVIKSMPHDEATRYVRETVAALAAVSPDTSDTSEPEPSRVLGWHEIVDLADDGVSLAPHSRTHPMLDQLRPDQLTDEIDGSLADMREHLGADRVVPVFAYPAGGHDPTVRAAVAAAGFSAAFTTERGLVDLDRSDPHRLPRLNIGRGTTIGSVATESSVRRIDALARGVRKVRAR